MEISRSRDYWSTTVQMPDRFLNFDVVEVLLKSGAKVNVRVLALVFEIGQIGQIRVDTVRMSRGPHLALSASACGLVWTKEREL
jgi:hypothetical protein